MKQVTPNFIVADVVQTVNFYTEVFGFKFVMGVLAGRREIVVTWDEDTSLDFAMVHSGEVELMFESRSRFVKNFPSAKLGSPTDAVSQYFELEDIQTFYDLLKDQVEIVKPLYTTFYGMKEFFVRDNNGFLLGFTEPLPAEE